MKRNKLLGIFGGLSIAVAGVAAVIGGLSNKEVEVKADHTMSAKIKGDFTGGWAEVDMVWSEHDSKYIYSIECTSGQQFGFTLDGDWKGYTEDLWTYGWKVAGKNGNNFEITMSGTYTFGVDEDKNISAWFTNTRKIYIENGDFTNAHIYGGKSGDKTTWPGVALFTVSDPYLRNGSNATIKYAVMDDNWDSTTIIFNGGGKQTNDLATTSGTVYTSGDGINFGADTNCTDALAFVGYWRSLRKDGSICDVYKNETKRNEVIGKYTSLGDKTLIDDISDYNDSFGNHTIKTTVDYLKGYVPSSSAMYMFSPLMESNAATWIIVAVSLAGLTAIGGFFFYKKRKEN